MIYSHLTHKIVNGRTVPLTMEKKTMNISETSQQRLLRLMKDAARETFREEMAQQRRVDGWPDINMTPPESKGVDVSGREIPKQSFGRMLQLAYRAQTLGDQGAAQELRSLGITKAMQEDTDSEGGFSIPTGYIAELMRVYQPGNLESGCRKVLMDTKTVSFPDLATDISAAWVDEEGAISETTPVLGQVTLTAKKIGAYTKISNELLQDARPDVVAWLDEQMSAAITREVDNCVLNGNTSAACSGILSAAAGYSVIMATGLTNFSSVTASNLSQMITKLKASVLPGCRFIMHPSVFHYVRTLTDSQNAPIYSPIGGAQSGTIWGYPYTLCDSAPSSSGAATPFIAFGNLRYFLMGDRMSLSLAIDPYGLFTNDQTRVRWTRRLAPKIGRADCFVRLLTAA
jgi:HK97 family phage major capsid protein